MSLYPAALAAHLAGEATTVCHCWKLVRADMTVLGFTDHDRRLTVDGIVYEPDAGLSATEAQASLGLAVDAVDVEGALDSLSIDEADIAAGLYDGATVETYLVNWASPADFARIRSARIGRITRRDGAFVAELESIAQSLDRVSGRVIRRTCDAELGDGRCGVDLSAPGLSGAGYVATVEPGGTVVVAELDAFGAGWFTHGVLTWTDGAGAGRVERVLDHQVRADGVRLNLWREAALAVQPFDTFEIVAGCDKTFASCRAKFDNHLNFRGFPHLPGNDAAYGYVADGNEFDGEALVP